jgi:ethanolamine utilization protein
MVKDKITLNVLADIKRKVGGTTIITSSSPSKVEASNKALVVFNGSNIDLSDKLREIKMLQDNGVSISVAFSFMGDKIVEEDKIIEFLRPERVYKEENILELKSIADRYSYIVAPTLTISTMSKVAQGLIDNFISNVIWTFLYLGKEVYIDFTSTQNYLGEKCNNQAVERVIEKQVLAIKDLGAIEIKTSNYIEVILKNKSYKKRLDLNLDLNTMGKSSTYTPSIMPPDRKSNKKVLTGKDIEELAKDNSSITLQKGSILTPLAKDKIRDLKISVNYL